MRLVLLFALCSAALWACSDTVSEAKALQQERQADSLRVSIRAMRARIDSLRHHGESMLTQVDSLDMREK